MSLASIKEKEAKGKRKTLPRLRTILANPYKNHCPVLKEIEVQQLRNMLKNAIQKFEGESETFATLKGIHLGLGSSLTAINSKRFSCLLISLSLRPAHLIRIIGASASVKVPTAPIYAQPKLEELTQEIFGKSELALALPLDLKAISGDLEKWVASRRRPAPEPKKLTPVGKKHVQKPKSKPPEPQLVEEAINLKPSVPHAQKKDWDNDFISFSADHASIKVDPVDVHLETQRLDAVLSNLALKGKRKVGNEDLNDQKPAKKEKSPSLEPIEVGPSVLDEDEFLPSDLQTYRPLTVHKVRPNPGKKPKKKRNKKQKQPPSKSH
ncbi:hypothetical protein KR009_007262 [Drosophila setifemur]|nr:hypothetical protein KR009_007262 [Drosophila setifemur]